MPKRQPKQHILWWSHSLKIEMIYLDVFANYNHNSRIIKYKMFHMNWKWHKVDIVYTFLPLISYTSTVVMIYREQRTQSTNNVISNIFEHNHVMFSLCNIFVLNLIQNENERLQTPPYFCWKKCSTNLVKLNVKSLQFSHKNTTRNHTVMGHAS